MESEDTKMYRKKKNKELKWTYTKNLTENDKRLKKWSDQERKITA